MVLAELGSALQSTLRKLQSQTVVSEEVLNVILNDIARALIEADVNIKQVSQMKAKIKARVTAESDGPGAEMKDKRKLVQKAVSDELVAILETDKKPYVLSKKRPNVIMFVGLQGAGKTTTIAKFAGYYARKGWKVCMVCCDSFRAGAFDQLKQNATKLRVPFYGSYTDADPVSIAEKGVKQFKDERYEIILIDTSGRHRQEAALFDEMQEISAAIQPDNTVFVMDATQGQAIFDQAKSFHDAVDVGSVIVTKLDGHAKGGGALSAVAATQSPIIFLGMGEHFDDFEPFVAKSFVSKLLGFGDMKGFMKEMQEMQGDKAGKKVQENMMKGKFSLRDMYEQFNQMNKLGPMSKVMGMIPGMGGMGGGGNDAQVSKQQKRMLYSMDSMEDEELDGVIDFKTCPDRQKRILRIAAGSGTHPVEVEQLLKQHKMMEGMIGKMGKQGLGNPKVAAQQKAMQNEYKTNPNALRKKILDQMDPEQLKNAGGIETVMESFKTSGGGAEADKAALVSNMMKNFGMMGGMGGR